MTHYYKNCNNQPIRVATGFVDGSGQISTYVTSCADVGIGQVHQWFYEDGTNPGVNYQTIICRSGDFRPIVRPAAADVPCWTTFLPPNPNGGPMLHRYKNCSGSTISVASGLSNGTGQIAIYRGACSNVRPGEEYLFDYQQTTVGINYHTIICLN
ncbi:hypothetical protein SK803_06035 [Lentzea sp. BCCO 10_0856]|uniref:SET domain-containing protein n=1 Tax=Lentzea miocenica TaxID=3095431 RepID=A0ABU4SV27_9PSEU|nr:hypothetical protein [Lentzea sp. BCCO 10_0856]MDX8029761.1 hypothetical protein [Lentzea sp. BCCO 10_0856]